jgi:chromosome partitioning protein
MKKISFLNIKGGVGKSTMSFNLATEMANRGSRVLLIDYDPQSNTTVMFLNVDEDTVTICDVMRKGEIDAAIVPVGDNLWLVPSELSLSNMEMELRMRVTAPTSNLLEKLLETVSDRFDYAVIDSSPYLNLLTINAIVASDRIVIPIKPDVFALQGYKVTVENIGLIKENYGLDVDYRILFTMVNRNNVEAALTDQLREREGGRVYRTQIRNQPRPIIAASSQRRMVINDTNPNTKVAADMRAAVDEILEDVDKA